MYCRFNRTVTWHVACHIMVSVSVIAARLGVLQAMLTSLTAIIFLPCIIHVLLLDLLHGLCSSTSRLLEPSFRLLIEKTLKLQQRFLIV
jgi:hypothetical protein